jgi:hypothetical protein
MNRLQRLETFVERCREAMTHCEGVIMKAPSFASIAALKGCAYEKIREALASLDQPAVVGEDSEAKKDAMRDLAHLAGSLRTGKENECLVNRVMSAKRYIESISATSAEAVEQIDERAQFESACQRQSGMYITRDGDGYLMRETQMAWNLWQDRAKFGETK